MYFIVSEQLLGLEIQFTGRSKEEGENWQQSILFPAPQSLPDAPVGGTDVPRSQYRLGWFPLLPLGP